MLDIKSLHQPHFHTPSNTLFELDKCEFCGHSVQLPDATKIEACPAGVLIWGEKELPPLSICADDLESEDTCTHCKGVAHYVEQIKSEWAVIKRPHGELASDLLKSEKSARKLCDELNGLSGTVNPAVAEDLTFDLEDIKLDSTMVIRLTANLNEMYQRGTHVEVPMDKFLELLNETGAKTMAKQENKQTAKQLIRGLITKKKDDATIIAEVQKAFPESNVDKKHCTKYRRELFVEGVVDGSLAAVNSKDHQDWVAADPKNLTAAKRGPHKEYWKERTVKEKAKADAEKAALTAKKAEAKPAKKATKKPAAKKPSKKAAAPAKVDA